MKSLKKFNRKKIQELIKYWDWDGLKEYNFRNADLKYMDLEHADFSGTDLSGAGLFSVTARGTRFIGASLRGTDLRDADLRGASLRGADLRGANLYSADLCGADLREADLRGTNFHCARLSGADTRYVSMDADTAYFSGQCPEKGAFTGFKKAYTNSWHGARAYIVELRVPEYAKRSSGTSKMCRCSEAEVVSISRINGWNDGTRTAYSGYDQEFRYTIGETVKPSGFDPDRWKECAPGIHFFMEREAAARFIFL